MLVINPEVEQYTTWVCLINHKARRVHTESRLCVYRNCELLGLPIFRPCYLVTRSFLVGRQRQEWITQSTDPLSHIIYILE